MTLQEQSPCADVAFLGKQLPDDDLSLPEQNLDFVRSFLNLDPGAVRKEDPYMPKFPLDNLILTVAKDQLKLYELKISRQIRN